MPSRRVSPNADTIADDPSPLDDSRHLRLRFAAWVDDHSGALMRFAYRMTGQVSPAEDLVQETFQQAWQGIEGLRDPEAAVAWLFRILRSRYARWLRQQKRMTQVSIDQLDGRIEPSAKSNDQERFLDHDELQTALAQLEPRFKEPLLLVVLEEMPVEQVSRILQLRRGTVLSRVHRGKQKLERIIRGLRGETKNPQTAEPRCINNAKSVEQIQ